MMGRSGRDEEREGRSFGRGKEESRIHGEWLNEMERLEA